MSYYGIGGDPRNRFRKLPRVKRSRSSVGNIRGGGSIGLPNKNQLMGAQPPAQRIPQRQQTGGGSSITTGPEQTPPEEQGLLGGILQAKGAYEGVKEAATGGKNIRNYVENFDTRKLDPSNWRAMAAGYDFPTLPVESGRGLRTVMGESPRPVPEMPHPDDFLNMGSGSTQGGFAGTPEIFGAHTPPPPVTNISQLQSMSPQAAIESAPKFLNGTQVAQGSNLSTGAQGILGSGAGGVQTVATGTSAVNPGSVPLNTGGATSVTKDGAKALSGLESPPTQGVDKLGVAGAGLGVGLSAYDISQNGINFGNATGLAGSSLLAYSAMTGGPTNPVGVALLLASAADSIFDIF